jgi:dolichol-phosphate mannosyltransferase
MPAAPASASSRTLIVIPTYNEREILGSIVQSVRAAVPAATIQIVDDNSPDGTGQLADQLAAEDKQVRVLHRAGKEGLGAAYKHAFALALDEGWDRIVQMDADFSHDPRDVPRLLAALDQGADLAIGSRYVPGGGTQNWGIGRKIVSRGGGLYARTALGIGVQDLTAGFKAWQARTLRGIDLSAVSAKGYGFQIEMTFRALRNGFRATEVPVLFVDRRVGQSKMTGSIFFEALTLVWRLRLAIPRGRG